jgi:hypothetical protein
MVHRTKKNMKQLLLRFNNLIWNVFRYDAYVTQYGEKYFLILRSVVSVARLALQQKICV